MQKRQELHRVIAVPAFLISKRKGQKKASTGNYAVEGGVYLKKMEVVLFQQIPAPIIFQYLHLLDCYLIEFHEPFALRYTVVDKDCIDILHI